MRCLLFRRYCVNITIFGKTGTGKSVLGATILDYIRADIPIFMLTDNSIDFTSSNGVMLDIDYTNYKKLNYEKLFEEKRVKLMFGMISDHEINEFMDRFSFEVYNRSLPCVIVIDEAHIFYGKRSHSKILERLVRGGRKKHIHIIMITQQIIDLDLSILKQSKYVIVFRLSELNDIQRTALNINIDPVILSELAPYHYVIYNSYTGELIESVETKIPEAVKRPELQIF